MEVLSVTLMKNSMSVISLCRCLFLFSAVAVPPVMSWFPFTAFTCNGRCREVRSPSIVQHPGRMPRSRGIKGDLRRLRGSGTRKAGEDALEGEMLTVMAMRVSEIKKCLSEMNIGTTGVYEKEDLAKMLAVQRIRSKQETREDGKVRQSNAQGNPRRSAYRDSGWTPPPETWTEAGFGLGRREARVTPDGTVLSMIRIRPSESVLGDGISVDQKDYYCVEVDLPDAPRGATTELFMLDTAATSSLLTPKASKRLGAVKTGISAMGAAGTEGVTGLYQVSLGEAKAAGQSFGTLKAVVMELPITDIRGKGSEGLEKGVSGILGMDFLSKFDVKLDFQTGDATFADPGVAARGGLGSGDMTEVEGRVLPTGFFVIDVKMRPSGEVKRSPAKIQAIVDLGSAFTIANWPAGKLAGLDPRGPNVRYNGQVVAGAAAPGEVYKPVEVGEANMDIAIGVPRSGGVKGANVLRGRPVMLADLPGFKAMGIFGPTIILGSDVLKLGKGAMIVSFFSRKIWLAL